MATDFAALIFHSTFSYYGCWKMLLLAVENAVTDTDDGAVKGKPDTTVLIALTSWIES